jgi:di/tricarboxylate transporter
MGSFLILFASDVLGEKQVRSEIDWNFLISFGALIGFGGILSASGLTDLVAQRLKPYLAIFSGSPYLFLPVVSLAIHLLRLALPLPAALLIGILSVVPISGSLESPPWWSPWWFWPPSTPGSSLFRTVST